jgi:cytosine/adenosine deaminase-related metal-dependent hydrolase
VWVARLLELRDGRGRHGLERDTLRGAARCLATGTTLVGDVDTTGASERSLSRSALRLRVFREVLDAQDPHRTAAAIARAAARAPRAARLRLGLAPHAPYSVSPALLEGVGRLARRRHLPVSVHWSETAAEVEWLSAGSGPLTRLLGRSPGRSGLDLLESAGLLGERLVLVHGNLPARGEPGRIARSGATLVHCPGSHAWFGRPPFPLERYLRAGVRLALGTDSLASNEDLDLAREMALLRTAHPGLGPEPVWRMATEGGARAVGHAGEAGILRAGALADVVSWRGCGLARREGLEALTHATAQPARVWIGGREAWREEPR